ncbi:MAG: TrkH family potassium uptake protein [Candidatus Omnitrophota bacterium]
MILRPQISDIKIINFYLGKIIVGIGLMMLVPLATAAAFGEWDPVFDYALGSSVTLGFGFLLIRIFYTKDDLNWMHGMIITAVSWVVIALLGAIPLHLSGHFAGFLDAYFDSMSGFATTGLTLINDLDHLAHSHNMWRHLTMFIGGQGIIVIALTFLIRAGGAFTMYAGEAREERILPNVMHTARFIWTVSIMYLVIGSLSLAGVAIYEGMPVVKSFLHGLWIFIAAWDTGGFAPHSQNILYYHSFPFEIITLSLMILGAISFRLHYEIWSGNKREIFKNIETVTFFFSLLILFSITAVGLARQGVYGHIMALLRKGFYQVVSGHVGAGYSTLYAKQFNVEWSDLAKVGTIIAMALGGCTSSTCGGIKMLRIGVIFKGLKQEIKRIMSPHDSIVVQKFHHITDVILKARHVRMAALIMICYLILYFGGAIVGMLLGYPALSSLFESVSAAANVGLSCGMTVPSMPTALKATYIIQMWLGRLEFISIFAFIGFVIAIVRGK